MPEKNSHTKPSFEFDLQKSRPWWHDALTFIGTMAMIWGVTHITMNFGAYAQITQAKILKIERAFAGIETPALTANILSSPVQNASVQAASPMDAAFADMALYPADNRIYIPSLEQNIPLLSVPGHKNWNALEDSIQTALRDGVAIHPISRPPDEPGNLFVTGHSSYYFDDPGRFKDVFAALHEMDGGEDVIVFWEGKKYVYRMNAPFVVNPRQVEVLAQPEDKQMLTLATCTPIGTAKNRLILQGELLEAGDY